MARPAAGRRPVILHLSSGSKDSTVLAAWLLILIGLVVACIPGIGLAMLFIGFPICVAVFILGIVATSRGRTAHGIGIIFSSFIAFGVFCVLPWFSLGIGALIATHLTK
jgi:hypothetical protein